MFGAVWSTKSEPSQLEVKLAQVHGNAEAAASYLKDLMERGSSTAQRLEVIVKGIDERLAKLEDFASRGPRFTKDDGDRLERRVTLLEERVRK